MVELIKFRFFWKDAEPKTRKINLLNHLQLKPLPKGEKEIKLMNILFNVCKMQPEKIGYATTLLPSNVEPHYDKITL